MNFQFRIKITSYLLSVVFGQIFGKSEIVVHGLMKSYTLKKGEVIAFQLKGEPNPFEGCINICSCDHLLKKYFWTIDSVLPTGVLKLSHYVADKFSTFDTLSAKRRLPDRYGFEFYKVLDEPRYMGKDGFFKIVYKTNKYSVRKDTSTSVQLSSIRRIFYSKKNFARCTQDSEYMDYVNLFEETEFGDFASNTANLPSKGRGSGLGLILLVGLLPIDIAYNTTIFIANTTIAGINTEHKLVDHLITLRVRRWRF